MGLKEKARSFPGFLHADSSIAGEAKLPRNLYLVCFVVIICFWDLTCDFAGEMDVWLCWATGRLFGGPLFG
jgi:hypothetical protein